MSLGRARTILAERSQSAGVILLVVLLELSAMPAWADGVDREGRAVVLVGRHRLETNEATGAEFVHVVLGALRDGYSPPGCVVVGYAPKASEFIAAIVGSAATEVLGAGPRESGKSQAVPAGVAILAEFHDRGGYPLPLRVLLVNESLVSFSMKMARSLEEAFWGNVWGLRNDRREAVLSLGNVEFVVADAVGAYEDAAAERLKTRCHVGWAEELTASLSDTQGIEEDKYTLAVSSISLPTPRPVMLSTCNPSDPVTSWVYRRFLAPGQPGCLAVTVPGTDRLSPERIAEQRRAFAQSPEQQRRLVDGEWVALPQGLPVAEGFDRRVHVARFPFYPDPAFLVGLGWDSGHSPSCVIGQNWNGQLVVFAALNLRPAGVAELIERELYGWLHTHCPWALGQGGAGLVHVIDPNMSTPGQATIHESAETMIVAKLGGRIVKGAVRWPPRREAIKKVLAPRHEHGRVPLQISPGPDTELLVDAFETKWVYEVLPGDQVDRLPKKPNAPWADIGDAAAYLFGWLLGGDLMETVPFPREITVDSKWSIFDRSRQAVR